MRLRHERNTVEINWQIRLQPWSVTTQDKRQILPLPEAKHIELRVLFRLLYPEEEDVRPFGICKLSTGGVSNFASCRTITGEVDFL